MHRLEWQTPEQAEWQANYIKERARRQRLLVDRMGTWRFCSSKACRRASACMGEDVHNCVVSLSRAMSDEERAVLWMYVQALQQGHSPQESERIVLARLTEAGL